MHPRLGKEPLYLKWLVETVQAVSDKPCAIDSPDPKAIETALAVHKGNPMINSISLEKERYDNLMPIVAGTDFKVMNQTFMIMAIAKGLDGAIVNPLDKKTIVTITTDSCLVWSK